MRKVGENSVVNFSVATNRQFTNSSGEKIKRTTWFRITVWNGAGQACMNYLSKGDPVLIEGRLEADPETGNPRVFTRKDGTQGASYEITAREVKFLPGGNGNTGSPELEDTSETPVEEEDEIPF
jgi:single-strand DNA-binding protein